MRLEETRKKFEIFAKPVSNRNMSKGYKFGRFRLDPAVNIVFRDGVAQPLGKRAVAVLRVLIDRAGEPVSKSTLIEAAWDGLAVEDSNLTVQIGAIRRVLAAEQGGD